MFIAFDPQCQFDVGARLRIQFAVIEMLDQTLSGLMKIPQGTFRRVVAKKFGNKPLQCCALPKMVKKHEPDHDD